MKWVKPIVIGVTVLVGAYIVIYGLNKIGVISQPVNDFWGILLGIVTLIIVWLQMRGNTRGDKMDKKLDYVIKTLNRNETEDRVRDEKIRSVEIKVDDHESRIRKLERVK